MHQPALIRDLTATGVLDLARGRLESGPHLSWQKALRAHQLPHAKVGDRDDQLAAPPVSGYVRRVLRLDLTGLSPRAAWTARRRHVYDTKTLTPQGLLATPFR